MKSKQNCKFCLGVKLCLAFGLGKDTIEEFRSITTEHGPYYPGEHIYRQQDEFTGLYSIQSGSVKAETVTEDGRQSVLDFFLPGDLFGLDAIGNGFYPSDAIAMETTWVCRIPYEKLLDLCCRQPVLQHRLLELMGVKLHFNEYNGKIVRNESAGHRVMYFLYKLAERQCVNHPIHGRINLPMSKQDVASYLGLTPESFSRTLSHLQNDGFLLKEGSKTLVLLKGPLPEWPGNLMPANNLEKINALFSGADL
ncbi:MAG: Crp/Fnr family transcriptional regulator [Motiliproteus sp.]